MRVLISCYCVIRTSTALLAHAMPLVIACLKVVGTYLNRCPLTSRDHATDHTHLHHRVLEVKFNQGVTVKMCGANELQRLLESVFFKCVDEWPPSLCRITLTAAVAARCQRETCHVVVDFIRVYMYILMCRFIQFCNRHVCSLVRFVI